MRASGRLAANPDDGRDAVDPGHGDVGDDHVGRESLRRLHQGVTILDRRNDVELRPQELAQLFRRVGVVFGQQQSWAVHVNKRAHAFS